MFITAFCQISSTIHMRMNCYFNPTNKDCKTIVGGVKLNDSFTITVFSLNHAVDGKKLQIYPPKNEWLCCPNKEMYFLFSKDGEEKEWKQMTITPYGWQISLKINEIGLYYYSFFLQDSGYIVCNENGIGELSSFLSREFALTVSMQSYHTPDWFKGGIMYQIFPDRFNNVGPMPDIKGRIQRLDWGGTPSYKPNALGKVLNNDFFGGNLKGIQEKLPYLKELGVTVIYLNPIFEAASNHRYDTSDYKQIDPFLGSKADFKKLVDTAKTFGISIILDGVFNHTGDDSVYFNKYGHYDSIGAYQSKDSPYASWYNFKEFPDKYSSWWGIDILPEVNENSKEYQEFIFGENGVLKEWLRYGIGGYRLDVADELPDFFLKMLRNSVKTENPDAIIIGEVWEDASEKIAYSKRREYLLGDELDSVMNYPLKDGIISYLLSGNAQNLLNVLQMLIDHYPSETLNSLMNILGTHDTERVLTTLGEVKCYNKDDMASEKAFMSDKQKELALKRLKLATVLQFTLPGIPCIYYGDENGMEGFGDPFCRRCFDWNKLNNDLISFYQKLGALRNNNKNFFATADYQTIFCEDGILLFSRKTNDEELYVYANASKFARKFHLNGRFTNLLENEILNDVLAIQPYSYGILKKIIK